MENADCGINEGVLSLWFLYSEIYIPKSEMNHLNEAGETLTSLWPIFCPLLTAYYPSVISRSHFR
jgi:hypothetical protein